MSSSGKKPPRERAPATKVVHSGRAPHDNFGFVNPPVYRGSTVLFPTVEKLWKRDQEYTYGRSSTPTVKALEEAIADVEGGAATALTASGYQAVSTAILAFVKSGDHILMVDSVYQPTRKFCDYMLHKLGVETTYYDPLIGAGIAKLVRPNTRLIFTESPGSQTFEVQDIPAIARVAAERELWLLMDNTWASPLYFRPFDYGVDVSIQAATKYIVGHADAMLGAITSNARAAKQVALARSNSGSVPARRKSISGCAGCAHWRRALPSTSVRGWRLLAGLKVGLKSRACCTRAYPAIRSMPFGSATS
jgi:cystathionine beta-lyase